ncbi:MAG: UbiA family prenyltransferase [Candidatus Eremiobacteraeota bacterium]|nr:UbiA family prenyltransferase [Candidatus Eremiobacteraeota bacterium]
MNRWWVYQRERFPIFAHGMLIAAFSVSAMGFSSLLRKQTHLPPIAALAAGFASSLLFFLQLRITDEFKDQEDDARYRPYRPVPRGLVTLRELGVVGLGAAVIQLALALLVYPRLVIVLVGVWAYLALMTREFFVSRWLKRHPVVYMATHMLIMPCIDFYVTAFDWLVAGGGPPRGLAWFLSVSFFNGTVVEIGRKIRAPHDEEHGVESYSFLWGTRGASLAWLTAIALTAISSLFAATHIDFLTTDAIVLATLVLIAVVLAARYMQEPTTARAKAIEQMSGVWTLCMYLSLGALPFVVRML